MTAVNKLPITGEIKNLSPIVSSFLPTLLLVSVAALMPVLVARSESLVRHWTRSSLNRAVMRKTLLLLLLMVLILPSLGLTSAEAFLRWTVNVRNSTAQWECVFLPDQVTFLLLEKFLLPFLLLKVLCLLAYCICLKLIECLLIVHICLKLIE